MVEGPKARLVPGRKAHPAWVGFFIEVSRSVLVVMVAIVVVPIALGMPAMISTAPVPVIFLPTTFPLGIQVAAAALRLGATLAVVTDRLIQS
jgi:hypothetical protein